jgi:hypothetical protein
MFISASIQTSTVGNHSYLADFNESGQLIEVGSHLACYMAGNWLLGMCKSSQPLGPDLMQRIAGGKLLNNQTIVDIALKLNDGCWNTYASTAYVLSSDFIFASTLICLAGLVLAWKPSRTSQTRATSQTSKLPMPISLSITSMDSSFNPAKRCTSNVLRFWRATSTPGE